MGAMYPFPDLGSKAAACGVSRSCFRNEGARSEARRPRAPTLSDGAQTETSTLCADYHRSVTGVRSRQLFTGGGCRYRTCDNVCVVSVGDTAARTVTLNGRRREIVPSSSPSRHRLPSRPGPVVKGVATWTEVSTICIVYSACWGPESTAVLWRV